MEFNKVDASDPELLDVSMLVDPEADGDAAAEDPEAADGDEEEEEDEEDEELVTGVAIPAMMVESYGSI